MGKNAESILKKQCKGNINGSEKSIFKKTIEHLLKKYRQKICDKISDVIFGAET